MGLRRGMEGGNPSDESWKAERQELEYEKRKSEMRSANDRNMPNCGDWKCELRSWKHESRT